MRVTNRVNSQLRPKGKRVNAEPVRKFLRETGCSYLWLAEQLKIASRTVIRIAHGQEKCSSQIIQRLRRLHKGQAPSRKKGRPPGKSGYPGVVRPSLYGRYQGYFWDGARSHTSLGKTKAEALRKLRNKARSMGIFETSLGVSLLDREIWQAVYRGKYLGIYPTPEEAFLEVVKARAKDRGVTELAGVPGPDPEHRTAHPDSPAAPQTGTAPQ